MTQYETYLKNFMSTMEVIQRATDRQRTAIPATTRLIAAELIEVAQLVKDSIERLTVEELDALSVGDFAEALVAQISERVSELLNVEVN